MPHKWDYPHWQKLFSNTTDLNETHNQFYEEAGYKLSPIKLVQNNKIVILELLPAKDYILKDLVLKRHRSGSMLVTGFYTGHFIFNMGLTHGFTVDGIDCYKEAVINTSQAHVTLPPNLTKLFRFFHGDAENLAGYPKYDVVVNFCLEHTRNPELAINEALKHLNPNGAAYFTPPIGHGTDSPTHLHHFQEVDLNALLPEGYSANFTRTKFLATDPYANCFIMEILKDAV